jgi:hypothetical protein
VNDNLLRVDFYFPSGISRMTGDSRRPEEYPDRQPLFYRARAPRQAGPAGYADEAGPDDDEE